MRKLSSYVRLGISAVTACTMFGLLAGCKNSHVPMQNVSAEAVTESGFDKMLAELSSDVDARAARGIPVPVPVDAGGGYTHEQHKQNAKTIYEAGLLYTDTGEPRYRDLVRDVLLDYADLYPTLGIHPEQRSSNKGKLFWQGLNEAVWLVYAIQGYDSVRDDLSLEDRARIENGVLNPMADFLSTGSPQTFDLIHNHATWAAAAVGMTGYVLGQPERVNQALYGLDGSGEAGFLRQLDELFSPDGYYAEGPYYQRYALMPFVLFSQAIEANEPERRIFEYRDGIVLKAIRTTLELSYDGLFFPINDAIREKGISTVELKYGLTIAYDRTGDPQYLGGIQLQDGVLPTPEGRKAYEAIAAGKAQPFQFSSRIFRDGPDGNDGALMVLRSGPGSEDAAIVFKATSQGLGHGHFDRLGLLYYDNGDEIVADYGAARFLNVEAKDGGRYLPENESWAKQTVAHNALVVDETSNFDADWEEGEKSAPSFLAFGTIDGIQIAAAETDTAYDGVSMRRIIAMVSENDGPAKIIDIVSALSDSDHLYDLPVHFKGQLIETSFPMQQSTTQMVPVSDENGYQHLWQRAVSGEVSGLADMSWLRGDQFYTLTFAADRPLQMVLAELGANDPNHNLRHEQTVLLRSKGRSINFVSVYERNGLYDSDEEVTVFDGSSVTDISIELSKGISIYTITMKTGEAVTLFVADQGDAALTHSYTRNDQTISWAGPVHVQRQHE